MPELHDLFDRATDAIEPRGGAVDALRVARRLRTQRRGTGAALAAVVAVSAVVVAVRVGTGGTGDSVPGPAETPTATVIPDVAPEIAPDRIQDVWDPRGVEGLPVTDLGVPRVMPSAPAGSIARPPVALLDDGSQVLAVAADGAAVPIELPVGVGEHRVVSLSPDGARVVVVDAEQSYWRYVNSQRWRRIHVELVPGGLGAQVEVQWTGASAVVLRGAERGARIDLDTGHHIPLADILDETIQNPRGETLERAVGGDTSIAAVRSGRPSDGLVAVDWSTWEARALLPMRVDSDDIAPIAWLDDDTVLFTVLPPDSPKEYLVTWDVETGELSRISCWLTSFQASFADDLLG